MRSIGSLRTASVGLRARARQTGRLLLAAALGALAFGGSFSPRTAPGAEGLSGFDGFDGTRAAADETPNDPSRPPSVKLLHATIQVLYATQAKEKFIDPQLAEDKYLQERLQKPPFVAFNSYQLLGRRQADLPWKGKWEGEVAEGRRLHLGYTGMTDKRFRISTMIDRADGQIFVKQLEVTAPSKEPFFVAGQQYKDGILVLEISVAP